MSLILTAVQLVFEIPALILSFTSSTKDTYFVLMVTYVCMLLGSIASLILSLFFAQSTYLLLDFTEMGAIESMKLSAKLMRGNKGRYFYLSLSFLGWFLLGALSCGIGYLWILPYASMTFTYFYMDVLQHLNPTDTI